MDLKSFCPKREVLILQRGAKMSKKSHLGSVLPTSIFLRNRGHLEKNHLRVFFALRTNLFFISSYLDV